MAGIAIVYCQCYDGRCGCCCQKLINKQKKIRKNHHRCGIVVMWYYDKVMFVANPVPYA